MARVNRIKITPKRKTDRRKPVLVKAAETPTDTIVIEDTDEEIEANISNLKLNPTQFFYEDRSPGLRDLEVPIYEIERKIAKAGDEICDASVIELDSTMDNTQESMLAKLNDAQPQSSSTENLNKPIDSQLQAQKKSKY
uniref:Uncharacterized protein n=1 Tax=Anopheles atroparvus TaxID=41427 RepID=A0A182J8Z1_ANOAO